MENCDGVMNGFIMILSWNCES